MESKLALYQLAAPTCNSCQKMGVPIKQWDMSFDNILKRFNQTLNAAGSVANLINSIKSGNPVQVGGQNLSEEEKKLFYQLALQNQNAGGGQAGNEAMMQFMQQNQQMMQNFMAMMANRNNNSYNQESKKDNTPLYIGLGIGGVLFITVMIMMMNKK